MLKILSWNIQQGGGRRAVPIVESLVNSGAHIIVLSEFRNNRSGKLIKELLHKAGFKYQCGTQASPNQNSVFIASKVEGQFRSFRQYDEGFPDNVLAIDFEAFSLYGMYLPHKKKHTLFDLLIDEVQRTPPAVLVGDFNSGKQFVDQKKSSFWYSEKLDQLESSGVHDAFRHFRKNVREYSWYSHQGNGYRYDHTYVSELLLPVLSDCYYLHDWRERRLSDHSPMVLEI